MADEAMLCTLNNVAWCDTVCRSHGLGTELGREMWIQPRRGPPYYSNGITVSREASKIKYAAIEDLKAGLPDGFSVKDSFACLDLGSLGFRPLFDAEWVRLDRDSRSALHGRPHPQPLPTRGRGATASDGWWFKVESEPDLVRWEAAWAAGGSPTSTRVFLPALLQDPRIAFFGVEHDGDILAGCAANRSQGDVVGFSNFFALTEARDRFREEAVARVAAFAPGSPVVGYDRGKEFYGLRALGFRSVGSLRVWLWP
jgi:hypothetical protein